MEMQVQILIATLSFAGAIGAAIISSQFFNRKNLERLTSAQAEGEQAKTLQITDKIAREWIVELRKEVEALNQQLLEETVARRAAIAFVQRLLAWIDGRFPDGAPDLPSIPIDLVDLLDR